eukprot:s387_g15.t1
MRRKRRLKLLALALSNLVARSFAALIQISRVTQVNRHKAPRTTRCAFSASDAAQYLEPFATVVGISWQDIVVGLQAANNNIDSLSGQETLVNFKYAREHAESLAETLVESTAKSEQFRNIFLPKILLPRIPVNGTKTFFRVEDITLVPVVAELLFPILEEAGVRLQLILDNIFDKDLAEGKIVMDLAKAAFDYGQVIIVTQSEVVAKDVDDLNGLRTRLAPQQEDVKEYRWNETQAIQLFVALNATKKVNSSEPKEIADAVKMALQEFEEDHVAISKTLESARQAACLSCRCYCCNHQSRLGETTSQGRQRRLRVYRRCVSRRQLEQRRPRSFPCAWRHHVGQLWLPHSLKALLECEGRPVSPNASTCEAHFLTAHASCPLPETYFLVGGRMDQGQAMLMGKLKCLERLKVLQDGQELKLVQQLSHLPTDVEKEEEEEALKQVEEAAARLQEDAKRKAEELRLLQIQLRAKDEVAAFRKEEEEAAEKKKQEQAAAEQKQVLEKQAEDLQMLQLQLLIQEEELTARKEEEKAAQKKKEEAAAQKRQEEELGAQRTQAAKDLPDFEPSVLVEALAMLLASEVVGNESSATAEWKEIQRLEEMQRARNSKQPGTKHEAICLNPPLVVVPGASVNA